MSFRASQCLVFDSIQSDSARGIHYRNELSHVLIRLQECMSVATIFKIKPRLLHPGQIKVNMYSSTGYYSTKGAFA